jgi:hypothetical protein
VPTPAAKDIHDWREALTIASEQMESAKRVMDRGEDAKGQMSWTATYLNRARKLRNDEDKKKD